MEEGTHLRDFNGFLWPEMSDLKSNQFSGTKLSISNTDILYFSAGFGVLNQCAQASNLPRPSQPVDVRKKTQSSLFLCTAVGTSGS